MKLLTALVLLYLLVDFGNPHVAGAHVFNPDESVEVVQLQRVPAPPAVIATPAPPLLRTPLPVSRSIARHRQVSAVRPPAVAWRAITFADPAAPEEG